MVGSYDCKPIRPLENDAIDAMMHRGVVPQEILFKGWVTLVDASGELRDHIMVVSNLRVTLLRSSELVCTMSASIPIMSLQSISASADANEPEVKVVFQSDVVTFISPRRRDVVQALMFASAAFSNGMLSVFRPQLNLPSTLTSAFVQPVLNAHETFLASLFAMSDFVGVPMRSEALSYLLACFANNVREFSFGSWASNNNKVLKEELSSISTALSFSSCFRSIVIDDVALNESLMGSIASILSHNRHVRSLELQKTKLSKNAVLLLTRKMSSAQNHLRELTIASSTLHDAGGEALADALMAFRRPLSKLVLQDCCLMGKALRAISIVLQKPIWLESLSVLGLGANRFAKDDAVFLASVLRQCKALNVLDVNNSWRTSKALTVLLTALRDNTTLSNDVMNWINVSGTKLDRDGVAVLCDIVRSTASLHRLYLRNCGLKRDDLTALLGAIDANAVTTLLFELSLDGNPLAFNAALYERLRSVETPSRLQTLDVSRCGLGKSGVTALCRALAAAAAGRRLTSLVLDCNEKSSLLFGGSTHEDAFGNALVTLLDAVPTLSTLSVGGDDAHHWGAGLNPLLEALCDNTTLKSLNLVGAKLPESTFARLFTMVAKNDFMTVLSLDRNRFTVEHVEALADAVLQNRRLTDSAAFIPRLDIAALCASHRRLETQMRAVVERITRHLDAHAHTPAATTAFSSSSSNASTSSSSVASTDVSDNVKVNVVVVPPQEEPQPQQELLAASEPGGTLVRHLEKSFRSFMPSDWRQRRNTSYNPLMELFVPEDADQKHTDESLAKHDQHDVGDDNDDDFGASKDDEQEEEAVEQFDDIEYDTEDDDDDDDDDDDEGEEEREVNDVQEGEEQVDIVFNSKGRRVYELHELTIGQEFPLDVVASQREKHLCDSAFESVFNMRFEQFEALPKWRQLILKKSVGLF